MDGHISPCLLQLLRSMQQHYFDVKLQKWTLKAHLTFHLHSFKVVCTSALLASDVSLPQKKTSLLAWCHFKICPATFTVSHQLCHCVTVCALPKTVCVRLSRVLQSHTERSVPTRLKKRCPEVGCPFPTSSPFQRLEIPLRTKRPDMIPQHCRRGREQGTVLIRRALLSGKILKGMQPIVVNCMGPHSIPSATGMCYWFWIGETSILTADQCLCFVFLWLILGFLDCTLFFFQSSEACV